MYVELQFQLSEDANQDTNASFKKLQRKVVGNCSVATCNKEEKDEPHFGHCELNTTGHTEQFDMVLPGGSDLRFLI